MYVRVQKVRQGGRVYEYVHIVEGYRDEVGKVRHRVVANLGRRDRLKDSGALDNLAAAFTRLDPAPGRYLVGALPLLVPVLERLDVAGIVDRACPMRGRSQLTHGEVIAALVANRLTAPRPLYDVADWAAAYATNDWLGTPAGLLNDDRLGRALDALAGRMDEVASAVALAAIAAFGVDAARLHWDFTSVAFCGAYADQHGAAPRIGFGHSSDRQAHRRQFKVAHATTAAGFPCSAGWSTAPATKAPRPVCSNDSRPGRTETCCSWPTRRWSPNRTWPPLTRPASGSCPGCPAASTTNPMPLPSTTRRGGRCATARPALGGGPRVDDPSSAVRRPPSP